MELLDSRDADFISFIAGLLELDPETRLSPMEALLHPFFHPVFPFSLLLPYMLPCSNKNTKRPLTVMVTPRERAANNNNPRLPGHHSDSVHDMLGVMHHEHLGEEGIKRVEDEEEGEQQRSRDETAMEEDGEEEVEEELVRWSQKRAKLSPHMDDPLDPGVEACLFEPSPVCLETSE